MALVFALSLCFKIAVVEGKQDQDRAKIQTIVVPSATPYQAQPTLSKSGFTHLNAN